MVQNYTKIGTDVDTKQELFIIEEFQDYSSAMDMPVISMDISDTAETKPETTVVASSIDDINSLIFCGTIQKKEVFAPMDVLSTNIANRIITETSKWWKSKRVIRSLVRDVNKQSVYTFCKNMLTISKTRSVLGDIRKYITYTELKHLVYSILLAADECELGSSKNYKPLRKYYYDITSICSKNPNKGVDTKTSNAINALMEKLFEEMSLKQQQF